MKLEVELDQSCNECDGRGWNYDWTKPTVISGDVWQDWSENKCGECGGKGRHPTELGRQFLDFLEVYWLDK